MGHVSLTESFRDANSQAINLNEANLRFYAAFRVKDDARTVSLTDQIGTVRL